MSYILQRYSWQRTTFFMLAFLLSWVLLAVLASPAHAAVFIQGTVTDATSGDPLENVRIEIHTPDGLTSYNDLTDASGNYSFDDAVDTFANGDSIVLEVVAPTGYNEPTNSPTNFTYSTGTIYDAVNFEMIAAPKTLSGTVTFSQNSDPAQGVDVIAIPVGSQGVGSVSDNTDANGDYSMTLRADVPEWTVYAAVNLSNQNTSYLPLESPVTVAFTQDSSQETIDQDFTVTSTSASVSGTFLDPSGDPLTSNQFRADCSITRSDGVGTIRKVDANSQLNGIGLPPGIYSYWCFHPALQNASFSSNTFVLREGEAKDLGTVQAETDSAVISGTVTRADTGEAINNKQVRAKRKGSPKIVTTNTDGNGAYSLTVGPGEWTISVTQSASEPYQLVSGATVLVSENGSTNSGNDLQLEFLGVGFSGQVTDSNSSVLSNLEGTVQVETADGRVFVGPVASGSFSVLLPADADGQAAEVTLATSVGASYSLSEVQSITMNGNTTQNLILTADDAGITGELKDETGAVVTPGVNDVSVIAVDVFGNMRKTTVGTDGSFSMTVPSNELTVSYKVEDETLDYTAPPSLNTQVTPISGQAVSVDFFAKEEDATIQGTVTNEDGVAVPLAPVVITNLPQLEANGEYDPADVVYLSDNADNEGEYSIPVPDGEYSVFVGTTPDVGDDVNKPEAQTVTVGEGETGAADLAFTESDATIVGSVTNASGDVVSVGTVTAYTDNGGFVEVAIDSDGTYSLPVDSGDTWYVVPTAVDGQDLLMKESSVDTSAGENSLDVQLSDSGIDVGGAITKEFDASQVASVSLPDGGRAEFAPYSIDTTGTVTVVVEPRVDLGAAATGDPVSVAYDINVQNGSGVDVAKLNSPVKITMPYDESVLRSQGVAEDNLFPQFFGENEEQWDVSGITSVIDEDKNEVVVYSEHLTKFNLAGRQTLSTTGEEHILVTPQSEGGPNVHMYDEDGTRISQWMAYSPLVRGTFDAKSVDIDGDGTKEIVTVPGSGFGPHVRVFEQDGTLVDDFFALDEGYRGGLRVAVGDLNGNGNENIVVGPADVANMNVRAYEWNGSSFELMDWLWLGGEDTRGVAYMHLADIDGNGDDELVGTAGASTVYVYDFASGSFANFGDGDVSESFVPYDSTTRANVAVGDIDGDGDEDIVTSVLDSGGPNIRAYEWNGTDFELMGWFMAYQEAFHGGVNVAVGDIDGDGAAEIATVPRAEGGPNVRVYDWTGSEFSLIDWSFTYQEAFRGGVNMMFADVDNDGRSELVTAPRTLGGPNVRVYEMDSDDTELQLKDWFFAYSQLFRGGVRVNK